MPIFSKNPFEDKSSPAKSLILIVVILLILGGVYSIVTRKGESAKNNDASSEKAVESEVKAKSSGLDPKDSVDNVEDVEKVLVKWVEANPELIIQSVMKMQQNAAAKQQENAQKNISSKMDDLYNHKNSPTIAPADYDVSIVEFFDYNCGYCKKANSVVNQLIKDDSKVRVVFKEFPILGASSEELSKVAIAVNMVDSSKYVKFHNALMKSSAHTTDEALKIAKTAGIDSSKVKEVLSSKKSEIEAEIAANHELGSSIGVNGTPAFVVGEQFVSGAAELESLKEKIKQEREKSKK